MKEFTQSVKSTLYDRARQPFTGTFILAWIAYNWKILVAIFFINEEHLEGITRIDYIVNLNLLGINNLVWKPFGIAVVSLISLGILNTIASWIVLQFKNFQFTYVDKRIKVDSSKYGELLDELKNIKDKWANDIQSINSERTDLRKLNEVNVNENNDLNTELSRLKERFKDYKNKINNLNLTNDVYLTTLEEASELLKEYRLEHGNIKEDRTIGNITNKVPGPTMSTEEIINIINKQYEVYKTRF
jgi:hypothetical protein